MLMICNEIYKVKFYNILFFTNFFSIIGGEVYFLNTIHISKDQIEYHYFIR